MKKNLNTTRTAIKISLVAAISLLLLIPLTMIKGVIDDREDTKDAVTEEVANSYAKSQTISAPYLTSYVLKEITVDKKKQTYVPKPLDLWITRPMSKPTFCIARFTMLLSTTPRFRFQESFP